MRKRLLVAFSVVLALAGCQAPALDDVPSATAVASPSPTATASPPARLAAPPADFAVRFVFGTCTMETLDTFERTFTRQLTYEEERTIPLTLTEAQMAAIYERMVAIDLWSYPEAYAIRSATGNYVVRDPSPTYRITVRAGGEIKGVYWHDEVVQPTTPEADRLRGLIRYMIDMVYDYPEVRALPTPTILCL
jgi:hypothetical protein